MQFIRKQIEITPEQDRALKCMAEMKRTSEDAIVSQALDAWVSQECVRERYDPFSATVDFGALPRSHDHEASLN